MSERDGDLARAAYEAHGRGEIPLWDTLTDGEKQSWWNTMVSRVGRFRYDHRLASRQRLEDGQVAMIMGREVWVLDSVPGDAKRGEKP